MILHHYLEELLEDPAPRKAIQAGRRVGKSTFVVEDVARSLEASLRSGNGFRGLIWLPTTETRKYALKKLVERLRGQEFQQSHDSVLCGNLTSVRFLSGPLRSCGESVDKIWVEEPDLLQKPEEDLLGLSTCLSNALLPRFTAIGTPIWRASGTGPEDATTYSVFRSNFFRGFGRRILPSWLAPEWSEHISRCARQTFTPEKFASEFLGAA